MTRTDRLRFAAALAASALLHLWLLSLLLPPQPTKTRPASFTVGLAPEQVQERTLPLERRAAPAAAPAPRPLGGARRDRPPRKAASFYGRPLVTASLVSTPRLPPLSALPDADSYVDEAQLSVPPRVAGEFMAVYPPRALAEGRRGAVVVQVMIGADGTVAEALVSAGADPELAAAARDAVRYARFTPARVGGLPTRAKVYFEVSFVIE